MPVDFQIFTKPVGASCNLKCSYCYYLEKRNLYQKTNGLLMYDEILELYIRQHIAATSGSEVMFSWHGGEPLLAGIEFYQKAVEIQKKYLPAGKFLLNGIQTNATLLNEAWCHFFKTENFILGVSLDGTEELHNQFRQTANGFGSFQNVVRGYMLLKSYGIAAEILCVVNAGNVKHPLEIYRFFRQLGAQYLTFLPLVIYDPYSSTGATSDSVSASDFGNFLVQIFDEWVENDIGVMKVQIFDEALRTAFNQEHTLCIFKENCSGVPVLEHNGDFYSCDHYINKKHFLGNIKHKTISFFLDSRQQTDFGAAKSRTLPEYCLDCDVKPMCNGECPKNRFIKTPEGEAGLNYLCEGYKLFFTHCQPFIEAVRSMRKNQ